MKGKMPTKGMHKMPGTGHMMKAKDMMGKYGKPKKKGK